MKRIFDHAMKCTECKWKGTVGECGDVEHKDGQLDCPICHAIATDDWERDNKRLAP